MLQCARICILTLRVTPDATKLLLWHGSLELTIVVNTAL